MACIRFSPLVSLNRPLKHHNRTQFTKLTSFNTTLSSNRHKGTMTDKFKTFTSISNSTPLVSDFLETETDQTNPDGKFDWNSQWYPVMPVNDQDKRVPHGKRVIGIDVVVWWDRNESTWKVFDDSCPHRLAPLSEGRIDKQGRLQCVYHGWCFNGGGACQLIPQAPLDGPPVHTFKKACATVYPSTVQNNIIWFWPNSDPQYEDILTKNKPPYIAEIDDPSYTTTTGNSEINYGYEILVENLMDIAHIPYAHYGIMIFEKAKGKICFRNSYTTLEVTSDMVEWIRIESPIGFFLADPVDREGGMPLDMSVKGLEPKGFEGKWSNASSRFFAPCLAYFSISLQTDRDKNGTETDSAVEKKNVLVFICVPVSPGKSRLIWAFPRNFAVWMDKIIPRWLFHITQNLMILDSDLYLLHVQEHKILEKGGSYEWNKSCFVPTKSDAFVVGFRKWLNKYAGGGVDWKGKFNGDLLPPTPPREQLFDRYWTHVVNCSSCRGAYKGFNVLKVVLQVISFSLIGIVAVTKQALSSTVAKAAMVSTAILCFVASKWLAHFIRKVFHFHDYNHSFR